MNVGRQVDFLIGGVQKGGTSALFEYLRELPGLQLPGVKEVHFFDEEEHVDWRAPDYAAYHRHFVEDGRSWGEATPIYIYWPGSIARIARYNPAMKIILLFRDPVERAWSQWKMEYAKGKEREPFAWCIREGRARLRPGDPAAPGHHRVFSYVERGFYADQVERLLKHLPREQCLFLTSEALAREPQRTLERICRHLDQPPPPQVQPRIVHAARVREYGSHLEAEDIALLADIYQPQLARFSELTGLETSSWLASWQVAAQAVRLPQQG